MMRQSIRYYNRIGCRASSSRGKVARFCAEPRFRVLKDPIIAKVDEYLDSTFVYRSDSGDHLTSCWTDAAQGALKSAREAGLPEYDVSPTQGKLLMMLGRLVKAERILEIGTLGGYSTMWLGRSLVKDSELAAAFEAEE